MITTNQKKSQANKILNSNKIRAKTSLSNKIFGVLSNPNEENTTLKKNQLGISI